VYFCTNGNEIASASFKVDTWYQAPLNTRKRFFWHETYEIKMAYILCVQLHALLNDALQRNVLCVFRVESISLSVHPV